MASTTRNPYTVLGVPQSATNEEIRAAWKGLSRWHPDKAPPEKKAEYTKKFADISEAYTLLSDPVQRRAYDKANASSAQPTNVPQHNAGPPVRPSPAPYQTSSNSGRPPPSKLTRPRSASQPVTTSVPSRPQPVHKGPPFVSAHGAGSMGWYPGKTPSTANVGGAHATFVPPLYESPFSVPLKAAVPPAGSSSEIPSILDWMNKVPSRPPTDSAQRPPVASTSKINQQTNSSTPQASRPSTADTVPARPSVPVSPRPENKVPDRSRAAQPSRYFPAEDGKNLRYIAPGAETATKLPLSESDQSFLRMMMLAHHHKVDIVQYPFTKRTETTFEFRWPPQYGYVEVIPNYKTVKPKV